MEQEIWKPIDGHLSYSVSTLGRVSSSFRGITRIMNPSDNGHGYKLIKVTTPKRKNLYVHRLVASAFLTNKDNLPEVNHKNGVKSDNRLCNLEWISGLSNKKHAVESGLLKHGESHHFSILTEPSNYGY